MTDTKTGSDLAQRVLASRRGLMCGLAGLGAAGALAACGSAEESPSSEGSSEAAPSDGGADSSTAGGGEAIAATADVPEGGGIVVDETVIVQPTADEFLAFSAVCPHQGAIVNPPDAAGDIVCPSHGSMFGLDGSLEQGPAETGLTEVEITVEDGQIFLA
ncbi:Rieske (2Fe-2S) protein [Glycomyces albidus]|jgi:Rieske Fe-S protein|uniref:Cytochrome bc1 complex Rieske iron-sulfur subunit n=1 Tax=Glycomyces albidus TaxID=2656774 RepID=A0A6L5GCK4_9ACTN|nr:Rieske (2Fe-2S) protein [Glycomyces albidus]MQM27321.1 Rieske 2Fe-2S domain-containing protein [Glycomyces albidus]